MLPYRRTSGDRMSGIKDAVREFLLRPGDAVLGRPRGRYRVHVHTGDRRGAGTDANVYVTLTDEYGRQTAPLAADTLFKNDNERNSVTSFDVPFESGLDGDVVQVQVWRDNTGDVRLLGALSEKILGRQTKRGSANWFLDRIEVEELRSTSNRSSPHHSNRSSPYHSARSSPGHSPCATPPPTPPRRHSTLVPPPASISPLRPPDPSARGQGRSWVFPLQRWVIAHRTYTIRLYDTALPQDDPHQARRYDDLMEKRLEYHYAQKVPGGPAQVKDDPSTYSKTT